MPTLLLPALLPTSSTGIGFLGAGVILFAEGKLKGLSIALSIWVAATLGKAVGIGEYILAMVTTIMVMIVLNFFARLDQMVDNIGRETRTHEIVYPECDEKREELKPYSMSAGCGSGTASA